MTSSRLPIGVGQTTSRPLTPWRSRDVIEREQGGAHHPRLVAEVGGRGSATPARTGGSARSATTRRAGSSSSSPAATAPPPITITSGLKTLTTPTSP